MAAMVTRMKRILKNGWKEQLATVFMTEKRSMKSVREVVRA